MVLNKLLSNLAVKVQPFALCEVNDGWRLRLPGPSETMLHFVLQGEGFMRGPNGETHTLKPFNLLVVPKGVMHSLEPYGKIEEELRIDSPPTGEGVFHITAGPDESELVLACGLINVNFGESLGLFDHLRDILLVDFSETPQVKDVFSNIIAEQTQSLSGSDTMTAALMMSCLVQLLRHLTESADGPLPWLIALEDNRLGRAIDKVLEDPTAMHSVESLATAASMSRSAFAEKFTAAFGHTPMQFVHQLRMIRAAKLLLENRYSIDEIAHKVSYSSRSHFSEAFKKQFGKSPTDYR
ncbi:MAG: helix-turn-helix transcriptional regulator [Opitutaceae bacterium]|nr:helix-turn-helix transcriptional regulator [Opitutaceae bacterium]